MEKVRGNCHVRAHSRQDGMGRLFQYLVAPVVFFPVVGHGGDDEAARRLLRESHGRHPHCNREQGGRTFAQYFADNAK